MFDIFFFDLLSVRLHFHSLCEQALRSTAYHVDVSSKKIIMTF